MISNVYTYKLVNKTTEDIPDVHFKVISHDGTVTTVRNEHFTVPKQGIAEGTLFIEIDAAALSGDRNKVKIGVYSGDELIETEKTSFLGPRSYQ